MDKEERLAALIAQITSKPRYMNGRARFPGEISDDDTAEIAEALMEEADAGVAARAAQAAKQGLKIACGRGCAACCDEMIMVWEPEAIAVARWLRRPENREVRDQFMAAYPAWSARVGDAPSRLGDTCAAGDQAGHLKVHIEHWEKMIPCAFNVEGSCTIYPIRPIKCRNNHALNTAAHCAGDDDSGIAAARLAFVPLDNFIVRTRHLLRGTHHAIGEPRERQAALCDSVYKRLTADG